jgi:hypothetical protein
MDEKWMSMDELELWMHECDVIKNLHELPHGLA